MYQELGSVTLKKGELVQAGVVIGPDAEWAERVENLLWHKGDPWNWQNSQALRANLGIGAHFYLLHRDGVPFAHIGTVDLEGAGFLCHVWTKPEERRKGACSKLMEILMEDFRARSGKALFLDTGFASAAYHIYQRFGFESVEPDSGCMEFFTDTKEAFESAYFSRGETEVQWLGWPHWLASGALFVGDFPGLIRCAPMSLIGRHLTQKPVLCFMHNDEHKRQAAKDHPRATVLCNSQTTAVVGLAAWDWHPLWRGICLVDIYCHPDFWEEAGGLWATLPLPDAERFIAYSDAGYEPKARVLSELGFKETTTLEGRVHSAHAKTSSVDVDVFEKVA